MLLPTIFIVPGAWQPANSFDALRALLGAAGFPTSTVSLPSVGGTSKTPAGLAEDVAHVQAALDSLVAQGRELVVYCHSYGGVVGSNAVQGLDVQSRAAAGQKGGVKAMVYASAFMLPNNMSLLDMLGGQPLPWMLLDGDRVVGDASMIDAVAFNKLSKADAELWAKQLTWTSLASFTTPSSYTPWTEGIPSYYIHATEDKALPLSHQQSMSAQLPAGSLSASVPSDHCAHLSRPEAVSRILSQWFGA